jgi:DNA repair exonuclease SbcCD ATPase subunit
VKLVRLEIQNFLSIQEASLYLKDKGLVSIEGVNNDPTGSESNGAGKSSIINAIIWNLYGTYGKDEGADDVVNSQAGKNCMVQTMWEDDTLYQECYYRITRYRKHKEGKNSIKVEQIRKPMAQGDACHGWKDITKAGAKEVQQQINEIIGADEMVFKASCFCQQETPLDIPAMTDKELKILLERCLPFEDFDKLYKEASQNVSDHKKAMEKLEAEIRLKVAQIEMNKRDGKAAFEDFKNYSANIALKNELIEQKIELKKIALEVATKMADAGVIPAYLKEIEAQLASIGDTDVGTKTGKIWGSEKRIEKYKKEIANPDFNCESCGQPVTSLEAYIAARKNWIAEEESNIAAIRKDLVVASENLVIASDLESRKRELQEKLAECSRAKHTVKALGEQISELVASRVVEGDNPHRAAVARFKEHLAVAKAKKAEFEAELARAIDKLEILEAVQLTYSPKGLRYHILEKVAPRLTASTNKYLSILTDGAIEVTWSTVSRTASGEFREKFSIEARMDNRSKFGLLSGGEKRKVRLACFFALQDLIASRASKPIELWVGDEIDHALDSAGLERLMVLLEEKAKDKSTILVISHNELKEWVPNTATVIRENGVTRITGYLNG